MRLSLLTLAATAPSTLGCTFGFFLIHNTVRGGANEVMCTARIFETDSPDFENQRGDAYVKTGCGGGCHKLDYKGETYEFCFDRTANNNLSGSATVQRTSNGGGKKRNIYPEGQEWRNVSPAFIGSTDFHVYFASHVACP
ncbi:hypothetical protein BDV23DRAFT_30538 [Aspergillus alliaceus]|uniref:Uncharacterized protein n=1 Tax=Petromyces alliaceus TaxID=209559 RepID=A0A5N7BSE2_PETAA|nr:hypothetical protein BDV23DRAFT_30538 [Aspergillus alliaceus]